MALTSSMRINVSATETSALDLGTASFPMNLARSIALATGTGNGQADRIFTDQRTLTASSSENLDLAGTLAGAYGNVTFARIKCVAVYAASSNANNVHVIREGTNGVPLFLALGDGIAVRPGGFFLWACSDATGVAVTGGTGDLLTLTNSAGGTSVVYDIIIIGASA